MVLSTTISDQFMPMNNVFEVMADLENLYGVIEEFGVSVATMRVADPQGELLDYISMGSYDELSINNEKGEASNLVLMGIADTIKDMWRKLVEFFSKLVRTVTEFFSKMFKRSDKLKEATKDELEKTNDKQILNLTKQVDDFNKQYGSDDSADSKRSTSDLKKELGSAISEVLHLKVNGLPIREFEQYCDTIFKYNDAVTKMIKESSGIARNCIDENINNPDADNADLISKSKEQYNKLLQDNLHTILGPLVGYKTEMSSSTNGMYHVSSIKGSIKPREITAGDFISNHEQHEKVLKRVYDLLDKLESQKLATTVIVKTFGMMRDNAEKKLKENKITPEQSSLSKRAMDVARTITSNNSTIMLAIYYSSDKLAYAVKQLSVTIRLEMMKRITAIKKK